MVLYIMSHRFVALYRKKSILLSHIFVFIGATLACSCVAAKAPEMLMLGRVFLGVNSGDCRLRVPVLHDLFNLVCTTFGIS